MLTYRKSYNPYLRGLRPRKFFPEVKRLTDMDTMTKDIRRFDPEWNKGKVGKRA